jgi:hypothetical protein
MEENPNAGLVDETSDIEIDYDEDGNPIAPPKKKVGILKLVIQLLQLKNKFILLNPTFYSNLLIYIILVHR